jgi:hypothetical protein
MSGQLTAWPCSGYCNSSLTLRTSNRLLPPNACGTQGVIHFFEPILSFFNPPLNVLQAHFQPSVQANAHIPSTCVWNENSLNTQSPSMSKIAIFANSA